MWATEEKRTGRGWFGNGAASVMSAEGDGTAFGFKSAVPTNVKGPTRPSTVRSYHPGSGGVKVFPVGPTDERLRCPFP